MLYASSLQAQVMITDSLIKKVIQSIYPSKSYLKLRIEELPSVIYSKINWENERELDKSFVVRVKGFDSSTISSQLMAREIICIDSLMLRSNILKDTIKKDDRNVLYILFSKDANQVIIKEQRYCGEDCGSDMIMLYKKNKRKEWIFDKSIFGGIY